MLIIQVELVNDGPVTLELEAIPERKQTETEESIENKAVQ